MLRVTTITSGSNIFTFESIADNAGVPDVTIELMTRQKEITGEQWLRLTYERPVEVSCFVVFLP